MNDEILSDGERVENNLESEYAKLDSDNEILQILAINPGNEEHFLIHNVLDNNVHQQQFLDDQLPDEPVLWSID